MRLGSIGARCAVLVLFLVCTGGSALAQPPGPDAAERRRKAGEHVQRGDAFKEAGQYRAAAREYERAYALVPHPVLFFNLAQVFRLDGDRERAIEFYERYLAAAPSGRASRQARQFAAQLRRELEILGRPVRDQARPGETQPGRPRSGAGRRVPQNAGDGEPGAAVSVSASRPEREGGRGLRVAGMIAAGAGLVAIGVGVKFGLDARAASNDINAHVAGQWPEELLARQAAGERDERNMFILTATGAVAIAAGGALYYFGHRARRAGAERPVAVGPLAPHGGLGLFVSGRF